MTKLLSRSLIFALSLTICGSLSAQSSLPPKMINQKFVEKALIGDSMSMVKAQFDRPPEKQYRLGQRETMIFRLWTFNEDTKAANNEVVVVFENDKCISVQFYNGVNLIN